MSKRERSAPQSAEAGTPLAWLARRRTDRGQAFLTKPEVSAGERLRRDFHLARLEPRVTTDWASLGAPKGARRKAGAQQALEMSEAAAAARRRVEAALAALGPDLARTALDVCCFHTRLADAERRYGWPPRSAKVVLKLALGRLAVHYGLIAEADPRPKPEWWRSEDARGIFPGSAEDLARGAGAP